MFDFSDMHLKLGGGNLHDKDDSLCIMQAVSWFAYSNEKWGKDSDVDWHPVCASRVLKDMAINLNDHAPSQAHRDSLWSLLFGLLNSVDDDAEQSRALLLSKHQNIAGSKNWCAARDALIEAIHMGKHGEEDKAYEPRYLKLREILSV